MKKEDVKSAKSDVKVSLSKRKAQREQRKKLIQITVVISVIAAVFIVTVTTLFMNIKTVEVTGNSFYSAESIIAAAKISNGKNILTFSNAETEENIRNAFPGINDVKVVKRFPSRILIKITEADEVMVVAVGEKYYSLNRDLRVIRMYESIEEAELRGLKRLYLPSVSRCITGEIIKTDDKDIPEMVKQLSDSLIKHDLFYDVKEIDFREKFDIVVYLGVKYTVKLGNILECDTKLEFLCGIIEKLDPNDVGTIDFSGGNINEAVFSRS